MIGGLALRSNLLCVTWSAGRGHVFLYDLEARERVSSWTIPVGESGFSDAGGVAMDRHFRIFVADGHNNCVRRYNAFGQHLGDLGLPMPASGDCGRDRSGVLDRPHAVAVHHDRLYVAMGERARQRAVQCFHVDGRVLPGLPARGDAALKWAAPRGIWADQRGVLIADTLRGRIQCFGHDGRFGYEIVPAMGSGDVEGDTRLRPGALARLADSTVLFVDHSGVRSELLAMNGDGTRRDLGELSSALRDPLALATDEQQRLYVLDHDGERVVRVTRELVVDEVLFDLAEHDGDAPSAVD